VVDYERLLQHTEDLTKDLLKLRMIKEKERAKEIAKKFAREFKYHGKTITIDECIAIGLKVEEMTREEWNLVRELNKLWERFASFKVQIYSTQCRDNDFTKLVLFNQVHSCYNIRHSSF
jgi:aspartate-semialdehyde dehydrogenase